MSFARLFLVAYAAATVLLLVGAGIRDHSVVAARAASERMTVQGKGVVWWSRRAVQARKDANARALTIRRLQAANRAHVSISIDPWGITRGLLCIRQFEGWWTANTGNGYHGGLQMDMAFQRAYGAPFLNAWGSADHWPAFVQVAVGLRAYLEGRGFGPWPNTRKRCGL